MAGKDNSNCFLFLVYYKEDFMEFALPGDKVVEDIKLQIYLKFQINPSKQLLEGWTVNPKNDAAKLNSFLESTENVLWVKSSDEINEIDENIKNMNTQAKENKLPYKPVSTKQEDVTVNVELDAAIKFESMFVSEYGVKHVPFHSCTLNEAIVESCFASVQNRKILALYLHNSTDDFAKLFCPTLCTGKIRTILEEYFYFLGWDISDRDCHSALRKSLNENIDANLAHSMIMAKHACLFIIYPIENSITISSALYGPKTKTKDIIKTLEEITKKFKVEIKSELELQSLNKATSSEYDINAEQFQQMMYRQLGNRDYDSFEYNEHELLKKKIGFSKYGPPESPDGYGDKKSTEIEKTYKKIQEYNNKFSEWDDQITISFIYNCLEPLPQEKIARAKKYTDYNPNTDINPISVFVIRKCHNSKDPCRIFIDSDNRIYESWKDYLENNKFMESTMILPKNGRYFGDGKDHVLLEKHLSPACGIGHQVLKGTDIASTALGIASGGVLVAAMIPAVAIAPIALAAAGATAAGVGFYSIVRSGFHLHDRYAHGEDMSFANSESRGAYINIVAGTLGFVGAGAATAVSQLTSQGVNIGQGARAVVNTLNAANLGVSGIGIANSSYQIYDDWVNEDQSPSWLTIVQLSSSILFFGNAVYNFKSVGTIIDETQSNTLKDIQDSLRSGRHRRTFNKMTKETIRLNNGDVQAARSEVISVMRNVPNRDEMMAVLTRNNKLFNKDGIRFSASDNGIKLNGIAVDLMEFGSMPKAGRTQILGELPGIPKADIPSFRTISSTETIHNTFSIETLRKYGPLIDNGVTITTAIYNMLQDYNEDIKREMIKMCRSLLDKAMMSSNMEFLKVLSTYFSDISNNPMVIVLDFVVKFFKERALDYELQYIESKEAAKQLDNFNETEFDAQYCISPGTIVEASMWVERVVYHSRKNIESILDELFQFTMEIISKRILDLSYEEERYNNRIQNTQHKLFRVPCCVCNGYYFSTTPPK